MNEPDEYEVWGTQETALVAGLLNNETGQALVKQAREARGDFEAALKEAVITHSMSIPNPRTGATLSREAVEARLAGADWATLARVYGNEGMN